MSCASGLSALAMVAGSTLLQNSGLGISSDLTDKLTEFKSIGPVTSISEVIAAAQGSMPDTIMTSLGSLGEGIFPSLGDALSSGLQTSLGEFGLADGITTFAGDILGSDLGVFAQHLTTAAGFVTSSNEILSAVMNSDLADLSGTFDGVGSLISGGLSKINLALPDFAGDLVDIGSIIDFGDLGNFGNPLGTLKKYANLAGGLPIVGDYISGSGLNPTSVVNILNGVKDVSSLTSFSVNDLLGTGAALGTSLALDTLNNSGAGNILDKASGILKTVSFGSDVIQDGGEFWRTAGFNPDEAGSFGRVIDTAFSQITDSGQLGQMQNIFGSTLNKVQSAADFYNPEKLFNISADSLTSITNTQSPIANSLGDVIQEQIGKSGSEIVRIFEA